MEELLYGPHELKTIEIDIENKIMFIKQTTNTERRAYGLFNI